MNVETWQVLTGLAVLAAVYWITVGLLGISPATVTIMIVAIGLGLFLGWKFSS